MSNGNLSPAQPDSRVLETNSRIKDAEKITQDSAAKSKTIRPRHVIILGGLGAFGPLAIDMYLPALPAVSSDLAASMSITQLTLSACILGLSLGQVIAGPVSDAFGRKRPLLIGIAAFIVLSLLCLVAPSMSVLIPLRFVQGVMGAAGVALALAIASDVYTGVALARTYSLLLMITGIAPIIAPVIGSQLLNFTSWRGIFAAIAIIAGIFFLASFFGLEETLPPERRQRNGFAGTIRAFGDLLQNRRFVGYALSMGMAFACGIVYVSVSPFVLQNLYGLSPQLFGFLFSLSAVGLLGAAQLSNKLAERVPPRRLLAFGVTASAVGGTGMLFSVLTGLGLIGILVSFFLVTSSLGLIGPNATTLALSDTPAAGSASALMGVVQFTIGAVAAPLVGLGGTATAIPMAATIAGFSLATVMAFVVLCRPVPADAKVKA